MVTLDEIVGSTLLCMFSLSLLFWIQIVTLKIGSSIRNSFSTHVQWRSLHFSWFHKYVVCVLDTALEVSTCAVSLLWCISAPLPSLNTLPCLLSPILLTWNLKMTLDRLYISGLQQEHLHMLKKGVGACVNNVRSVTCIHKLAWFLSA